MADRCLFCNEPATRLCDRAIAMVWVGEYGKGKGGAPYRIASPKAMMAIDYRCSAPCCDDHARIAGFICGQEADTIDNCEGCHGVQWEPLGLATPAEIEVRRRNLHAQYRRQRVRLVPEPPEVG